MIGHNIGFGLDEKKDGINFNPYPAKHNYSPICKQLGSGGDGEQLAVLPGSKLFDTQTIFSTTLCKIEAL